MKITEFAFAAAVLAEQQPDLDVQVRGEEGDWTDQIALWADESGHVNVEAAG